MRQSSPPRVKFTYDGKTIAKRVGGPIPQNGQRVNIKERKFLDDDIDSNHQFIVQDILYFLDDRSDKEDEFGMLVHITLSPAMEQHWYTE